MYFHTDGKGFRSKLDKKPWLTDKIKEAALVVNASHDDASLKAVIDGFLVLSEIRTYDGSTCVIE